MKKAPPRRKNSNGSLESAMALLIQNQAQFLDRAAATDRELLQLKRQIDTRLGHIETLLLQHDHLLKNLPDVIKEKIGFKKP